MTMIDFSTRDNQCMVSPAHITFVQMRTRPDVSHVVEVGVNGQIIAKPFDDKDKATEFHDSIVSAISA